MTAILQSSHVRTLQWLVAIGGLVPVLAGVLGIGLGAGFIVPQAALPIPVDSHWRYLSGLLLGLGIGFWSTIPNITQNGATFRLLTAIVIAGGIGRAWSWVVVGDPGSAMTFGLIMELFVTPMAAVFQYAVARQAHQ